jgi:hypothetical protein
MRNDYYTQALNKLSGSVIEQAISDPEGEFFGLKVKTPRGGHKVIWFMMDDEGNGPGSFEIQDVKA